MTRKEDVQGDVGVDTTEDRYTRECRWEGDRTDRPSQMVVTTVARVTGRRPSALRPLFEVVDPDALDSLFERNANRTEDAINGAIVFQYEGCGVRVDADGRLTVTIQDGED